MKNRRPTPEDLLICQRIKTLPYIFNEKPATICRNTGISASAWSNWSNYSQPISLKEALKLKEKYNISLDWLFTGETGHLTVNFMNALQLALQKVGDIPADKLSTEHPPAKQRTVRARKVHGA